MHRFQFCNRATSYVNWLAISGSSSSVKPILQSNKISHLFQYTTARRDMATAMGKRLEGKTVLITGASVGIGRSTALEFARTSPKSLRLILTARRIDALKQVAQEIRDEVGDGVKVLPFQLDVANPNEINNLVSSLPVEFQDIHILVNNA
jgi:3-hydroxy acid dehydrogenase/malonic semialdehyde reductase